MRRSAATFLLFALGGCPSAGRIAEESWTPLAPPDLGAVVARVGQIPVYANQVVAEAKLTGKTPRAALDDLVANYLLAEQARRVGLHLAGPFDEQVKSALVQRLLERDLEPNLRPEAIPDRVLRPLYDRVRYAYVHPRLVEIGVLAVYTGARMRQEDREPREQTARELALFLQKHPPKTLEAFTAVANDPAWAGRKVVFRRFHQSLDQPLSEEVGREVAKLHVEGETTRQISCEDGFFIARYIGERPPGNITYEQVRADLVKGYLEIWRQQQFLAYTADLMQAHKVEAQFDRLSPDEQGP